MTQLSALAAKALDLVEDAMVVGLGSGRASTAFIEALGQRVANGLRVKAVPTSRNSEQAARRLAIALCTLEEVETIDLTIDGADEVDPQGNCIKGYGGALVREKIVAAASKRLVILIGAEKCVSQLGQRGKLPVEVIPFARGFCERRIASLGLRPAVRHRNGQPVMSDNGNLILDCAVELIADAEQLEHDLRSIPGVVGTGLFLGMASSILIERNGMVEVRSVR